MSTLISRRAAIGLFSITVGNLSLLLFMPLRLGIYSNSRILFANQPDLEPWKINESRFLPAHIII